MAKRSKHEYVFGYVGDWQVVYDGKRERGIFTNITRLTLTQAKREMGKLPSRRPKTIYRLVPVDLAGREVKKAEDKRKAGR